MAVVVILTAIMAALAALLLTNDKEENVTKQDPKNIYLGSTEDSELIYEDIHSRSARISIQREDTLQTMAPVKFGLFKARSRDQQEQPSTENLLQTSNSDYNVQIPSSPIPSTSKGHLDLGDLDLSSLHLDSEDDDVVSQKATPTRRASDSSRLEISQVNYKPLKNQTSTDATSTSTLQDDDFDHIQHLDIDTTLALEDQDGASTSCDANSLQFDETSSIAPSEDLSVYCGTLKKPRKSRSKEEKLLRRDFDMWQASNVEVMQHLLSRSGTVDDQIKWEAIATARGLCTLTDNCTCRDCSRAKYLAGMADGDGGMGAAPLIGAISFGCVLQ